MTAAAYIDPNAKGTSFEAVSVHARCRPSGGQGMTGGMWRSDDVARRGRI
jgi:hypothetical protein